MEGKATFIGAGGGEYHYIPALNEHNDWIHALCDIALQHMQGWTEPGISPARRKAELQQSRERALLMGARQ